ncbi:MAG: hypothetical protein EB168_02540 [Euryarchaeota archaeon]|nr:hypothetical protein [Euryarchaeota archaeon]
MANRTFRVYGQAYAESGDVSVVMSVNGTQVFSGNVSDSSTVRNGAAPTTENHLWSWDLDEDTLGDLTVSITATGGELCIGPMDCNRVKTGQIIPPSWFQTNVEPYYPDNVSAENQQYIATQLGTALGTDLHAALAAGTKTGELTQAEKDAIRAANRVTDNTTYRRQQEIRESVQINGADIGWTTDAEKEGNWPILSDGDVLTYTWKDFNPDNEWYPD